MFRNRLYARKCIQLNFFIRDMHPGSSSCLLLLEVSLISRVPHSHFLVKPYFEVGHSGVSYNQLPLTSVSKVYHIITKVTKLAKGASYTSLRGLCKWNLNKLPFL